MAEIEFLGALEVELSRHRELRAEHPSHELFQTSTVEALLAGAFDGDVTLAELLEHGDLGLGTLDGLDGELIVLDGEVWKANLDSTVARPEPSSTTPYAVVVQFSPGRPVELRGPFQASDLERRLGGEIVGNERPTAIRIDGRFLAMRVRSVARQTRPYPTLAEAIARQHVTELGEITGTMIGFCFPDAIDGIEIVGSHLHFISEDRSHGGHVLDYTLLEATAHLDHATRLHVELPTAVKAPEHGAPLDQDMLHRLETEG
jgi:acetolactate decarboxylase